MRQWPRRFQADRQAGLHASPSVVVWRLQPEVVSNVYQRGVQGSDCQRFGQISRTVSGAGNCLDQSIDRVEGKTQREAGGVSIGRQDEQQILAAATIGRCCQAAKSFGGWPQCGHG